MHLDESEDELFELVWYCQQLSFVKHLLLSHFKKTKYENKSLIEQEIDISLKERESKKAS